ncbi:MAG: ABC transporter permease [Lachnospiraceae bacterium]|nr:ABC transporter permease [Lachnospiraceae bacterium]
MTKKISVVFNKFGVELVFIVMFIVASIVAPKFCTVSNLMSVLRQVSITAPIAFGMTFVIINGNIDISVGGIVGLSSMVAIWLNVNGYPMVLSILSAFAIGAIVGIINAYNVYTGLAPYIVTMCTNLILRGLCNLMTNGQPVFGIRDDYKIWGQGYVAGLSVPIIIAAVVYIILWFVLHHTTVGRSTYAVGGNREAARYPVSAY